MLCIRNELLFDNIQIDRADLARLVYLATYIDYNNRQENLLIVYKRGHCIQNMDRATMQQILGLSDKPFKIFLRNMKKNELIWAVDGKYYVSNRHFTRGKTSFNSKEYTRIFIDTTRYLYKNVTPRQHKILGYVFQLLPYSHYQLGVLCRNPMEKDPEKIIKMSLKEVCALLNISTDKGDMAKFRNKLSKLSIKYIFIKLYSVIGSKYYVIAHNTVKTGNKKDYFVINPLVAWAGNDLNILQKSIKSLYFD